MGKLGDAVRRFLESVDFRFREEGDRFDFGVGGKNGNWNMVVRAREKMEQVIVHSRLPMNVPEGRRQAMSEFIVRGNWGILLGNFELDLSDGELRFKTSIDLEDVAEIPDAVIRHLIGANMSTFDRFLPGMCSVIYGGASPAQAIRQTEGSSSSPAEHSSGSGDQAAAEEENSGDGKEPSARASEQTLRSKLDEIRSAAAARRGPKAESSGGEEKS